MSNQFRDKVRDDFENSLMYVRLKTLFGRDGDGVEYAFIATRVRSSVVFVLIRIYVFVFFSDHYIESHL